VQKKTATFNGKVIAESSDVIFFDNQVRGRHSFQASIERAPVVLSTFVCVLGAPQGKRPELCLRLEGRCT
jgi:hypothetical protein